MIVARERPQKTLKKPAQFSGIGLHSGQPVEMRFVPKEVGFGIQFCRTDLPERPLVPAKLENVIDTTRSTTIGVEGAHVQTVEHVLSALKAYEIDNLMIEVSDKEPPIASGGSDLFVEMIEKSGIEEQAGTVPVLHLEKPIFWSNENSHLVALPYKGLRLSYTLDYPNAKALQNQFYSVYLTPESFKREIAPCRTFSCYEEVEFLIDQGLIKGGSLDNTVIVKGEQVFSKEGLHMPEEMAAHKILDLIGDLSLSGLSLEAHLIGYRSGHDANVTFAKEILKAAEMELSK